LPLLLDFLFSVYNLWRGAFVAGFANLNKCPVRTKHVAHRNFEIFISVTPWKGLNCLLNYCLYNICCII